MVTMVVVIVSMVMLMVMGPMSRRSNPRTALLQPGRLLNRRDITKQAPRYQLFKASAQNDGAFLVSLSP